MGFIDSYKHLEKICGEVLNDERKVSAYIDEMIAKPRGSYLIRGWDEDLKLLKHYRHIRNQIVHEPGCSENNMCKPEDAYWLDSFYHRIMNQADPLALYEKATKPRHIIRKNQTHTPMQPARRVSAKKRKRKKSIGWVFALLIFAAILITLFALLFHLDREPIIDELRKFFNN